MMLLGRRKNSIESISVLYLTAKGLIQSELKKFFKTRGVHVDCLAIDKFSLVSDEIDSISTAVINTFNLDEIQHQKIGSIIETLENAGIPVIIINSQLDSPARSFHISDCKSFSLNGGANEYYEKLLDEIKENSAKQKQNAFTARPVTRTDLAGEGFKLAEQLSQASEMVKGLAEQLKLAGLVQRDFLPDKFPDSEIIKWAVSFNPAEWVSGDIYDVVRLDEDNIGFFIADAVGHSMPAALLTIFIKQAMVTKEIKRNNYRILEPQEVIANLNSKLAAQNLSGFKFVTCCYGIFNTQTLELKYARAGHPYPILFRPCEYPTQLQVRGALLGVFKNAEFFQETVQLQRGDKVLLYSDGAEKLVGYTDDNSRFVYGPKLLQSKDKSMEEIIELFTNFACEQKENLTEIDDVTALGFEVI